MATGRMNRGTCVKANMRISGNQRVIEKSPILQTVFDDKHFILKNSVTTERNIPRSRADVEPLIRFEPLPVFINQGKQ